MKKSFFENEKSFQNEKIENWYSPTRKSFFPHVFSSKKFQFQTLKIILLLFNNLILWFGKWFSIFHFTNFIYQSGIIYESIFYFNFILNQLIESIELILFNWIQSKSNESVNLTLNLSLLKFVPMEGVTHEKKNSHRIFSC